MACYSAKGIGGAAGAGATTGGTVNNGRATVLRKSGFDKYGQINYVNGGTFDVHIVKLGSIEQLSSIRTDTSASKSTIDENVYDGEVQFPVNARVAAGDGVTIESNNVTRQYRVGTAEDIYGNEGVDHIRVLLTRL